MSRRRRHPRHRFDCHHNRSHQHLLRDACTAAHTAFVIDLTNRSSSVPSHRNCRLTRRCSYPQSQMPSASTSASPSSSPQIPTIVLVAITIVSHQQSTCRRNTAFVIDLTRSVAAASCRRYRPGNRLTRRRHTHCIIAVATAPDVGLAGAGFEPPQTPKASFVACHHNRSHQQECLYHPHTPHSSLT